MSSLCIGLDGGGTSTRLLAKDSRGQQWTEQGDTSNPRIVGIDRASQVATNLIASAIQAYPGTTELRVCAGVAGAATSSIQEGLKDSIMAHFKNDVDFLIELTDDSIIAYEAAFSGDAGVLLMVGTGSMVLVRSTEGTFVRSGGWGYLLGDEGSGYSIGRAGVQAVTAAIDSSQSTALASRAEAEFGVLTRDTVVDTVYGSDYSLASFARAVLEEAGCGDGQSLEIVEQEVRRLVSRLQALTEPGGLSVPESIKVTGGLSKSVPYMTILANVIKEHFPKSDIARSGRDPVEGALWMASQMPA
jgi:N-acetylglucosamine kinase-like BadF-type ATPase